MVRLFYSIIYMSYLSIFVGVILMIVRGVIGRKLPAIVSYVLWGVLLIRLTVPISLSSEISVFNLYPITTNNQLVDLELMDQDEIKNSVLVDNSSQIESNTLKSRVYGLLPLVWFMGTMSLMILAIIAYLYTIRKFDEAIICKNRMIDKVLDEIGSERRIRVYTLAEVKTPVVCGIFKPKIIIPTYLINEENEKILKYVIYHEVIHIKRKDYIIKILAILVACVHWFNPVVWMALVLDDQDMERACDEKVIQEAKGDIRKEYAQALLSFTVECSDKENRVVVAFGESNVKKRLKGVLKYKKPSIKIKLLSCSLVMIFTFLLATNASERMQAIDLNHLKQQRQEAWVDLENMSSYLVEAAIVSQDKKFNEHNGVDMLAILRASLNNWGANESKQGGSTITQQLVKNICIFSEVNPLIRKRSEIYTAIKLERNHTKDEIIEAYLNCIAFGNGTVGVKEAATYYFNKEPLEITKEEAAQLMAIIDNPSKYDPIQQKENHEAKTKNILSAMGNT